MEFNKEYVELLEEVLQRTYELHKSPLHIQSNFESIPRKNVAYIMRRFHNNFKKYGPYEIDIPQGMNWYTLTMCIVEAWAVISHDYGLYRTRARMNKYYERVPWLKNLSSSESDSSQLIPLEGFSLELYEHYSRLLNFGLVYENEQGKIVFV